MQPEKHTDDLEYLSGLGFESVPNAEAEVEELVKQVRRKTFSYNSGAYFAVITLLTGVFLGTSLFFIIYQAPPDTIATNNTVMAEPAPLQKPVPPLVQLDTVAVKNENFTSARFRRPHIADSLVTEQAVDADTLPVVLPEVLDVSALLKQSLKEEKIRFIANAPVVYIHDLKVTDYMSLYFKKNQFVRVSNTAATYQNKEYASAGNAGLKQSADYFLHNELAQALLYFKKGKYDACMVSLNQVAAYNKEDLNCDFYLGMCYYYKKNYAAAIPLLERCMESLNNTFLQEATYYKALCLYESGDKNKALILFQQIADEGEFYAAKAEGYLKL